MVLRLARFDELDNSLLGIGRALNHKVVFYDSVTMYVYPVVFEDEEEAEKFAAWVFDKYGVPFNGLDGNHYAVYERYYKESNCEDHSH